ncbi:MAG: signal peptidase II [Candidatus Dependentiae bacterium]|nr:signal peptidase II [Candidatus Dependentiae bacterium]
MMLKSVKKAHAILFLLCFALPLFLDRITKYLIVNEIWETQTITSFFNLYFTYNRGIAWGIGSGLDQQYAMLTTFVVAAVLFYFAWYMRLVADNHKMLGSCLLILSGGLSNFFDRLWFGGVVDFIQLHYAGWYFPVFNIADVSITVGAMFLSYFFLSDDKS